MSVSITTKRVKEIRRKTRRKFSSEEKIRIVLEGLRGDAQIVARFAHAAFQHRLYIELFQKVFLDFPLIGFRDSIKVYENETPAGANIIPLFLAHSECTMQGSDLMVSIGP